MNNKYIYRSRISEAKFRSLLKCFSLDMEASKISVLTGISRNTINRALRAIGKRISEFRELESPFDQGEVEIDESYFWAGRVRGVRGRGAGGKTVVFRLIKRKEKVYTQVVKNCSVKELVPIIRKRVGIDSVIYTDVFKTYGGLVNFGCKKHYRIYHGKNEFAAGANHINGIENFWSIAKTRLAKFRGIHKLNFYLHLKECEFRFNHRHEELYRILLKIYRDEPLKLS